MQRLLSIFVVALVSLVLGCGSGPSKEQKINCRSGSLYDPATGDCVVLPQNNTNTATNNSTDNANNPSTNNANNPSTNNANNPTNNPTNNANNPTNNANNPTNNANNPTNNANNPTNNNTNSMTGDCFPNPNFFGQVGGIGVHDGGQRTTTPLTGDAGLDDVLALVPAQPDDPQTVGDEGTSRPATAPLVDGALVVATGGGANFGNRTFWLADGNAVMHVFLLEDPSPFEYIRVGQRVAFNATQLTNFEGLPEVTELSNFTILDQDVQVPIRNADDGPQASDFGRLVKFGGRVVSDLGGCGGMSTCYELESPLGVIATFRSSSSFVDLGDCVTFVGPVSAYPGPRNGGAVPTYQLDAVSFDWTFTEF